MSLSSYWGQWLSVRHTLAEQVNPWSRLKITNTPTPSDIRWTTTENTGAPKRREAFDEADILAILNAAGPRAGGATRYTKRTLLEVFSLGVLLGARPDEVCSLELRDIKAIEGGYLLNFTETKTKDDRRIPVVHPVAVAILKRRIGDRTDPKAQLFAEFKAKGNGDNLYELVGRALGRQLDRAMGLADSAVPYATRHTFATVVGNMAGVQEHALKRYIGHKPEGMTDKYYRSITPAALLEVARQVRYPEPVELRMREELGLEVAAG